MPRRPKPIFQTKIWAVSRSTSNGVRSQRGMTAKTLQDPKEEIETEIGEETRTISPATTAIVEVTLQGNAPKGGDLDRQEGTGTGEAGREIEATEVEEDQDLTQDRIEATGAREETATEEAIVTMTGKIEMTGDTAEERETILTRDQGREETLKRRVPGIEVSPEILTEVLVTDSGQPVEDPTLREGTTVDHRDLTEDLKGDHTMVGRQGPITIRREKRFRMVDLATAQERILQREPSKSQSRSRTKVQNKSKPKTEESILILCVFTHCR